MLRKGMVIPCTKQCTNYEFVAASDQEGEQVTGNFRQIGNKSPLGLWAGIAPELTVYFDLPEGDVKALEPEKDIWQL